MLFVPQITVRGPVLCRLGVLMLTADHVTVLGGEADSLANNTQNAVVERTL